MKYIGTSECEHPVALQLGGSDPEKMGAAAGMAEATGGFCEINGE
jgi:tRNA-dihydrouridine synthase